MFDNSGVDWSWAIEFFTLVLLSVVVGGLVVIIINSAIYTVVRKWKGKDEAKS